ncbi:CidA/LrgA family protein [Fructilactobacillus fructivorans]|uniref:Murein hydrolase regulator LrgA n=1 Tax=Fructilactobacillus fructivorans TaxID=1614 RepID=A0AAE6P2E2_9LACO|nr:CidA/LrgA family protein [Fructilactobacillus fructivorans]KRK57729.1 effector of murein hydrolase LrgA [Fructilactobacillus fructivorans]KRN40607.1 effector of murein hydrolase LrgA [Fructilactobacillus fructivorans]KRN43148.1 effector of murein hydrolase LrgA [Fructilactobacillus fructivorans]QFX92990.1 murein hydrolase regulator LrgA [Fructilactobacillus fructivorans]RDV65407.1 murein hydrolase regulator LrgA [Fructilactobacillus fructivorans]
MNNKKETTKKAAPLLTQLGIFGVILFVSSLISALFPANFPVPTPVIGLVILYLLLTFKIIKPEQVEKVGSFFIGILGFLFVPSGIQLAASLDIMKHSGVKLVIMIIISTVVMLVSVALVATFLIWARNKIFGKKEDLDKE